MQTYFHKSSAVSFLLNIYYTLYFSYFRLMKFCEEHDNYSQRIETRPSNDSVRIAHEAKSGASGLTAHDKPKQRRCVLQ